jgi:hypothetical protein
MINVASFAKKATSNSANVKSTTVDEFLASIEESGVEVNGVRFQTGSAKKTYGADGHTKNWFVIGNFGEDGNLVEGSQSFRLGIRSDLPISGASGLDKLMNANSNYVLYYGQTENGYWLSIGKKGEYTAEPVSVLDLKSIIKGSKVTAAVA